MVYAQDYLGKTHEDHEWCELSNQKVDIHLQNVQ